MIKKLLIICGILTATNSYAYTTEQQVAEIAAKLNNYSHIPFKLQFNNIRDINGWSTCDKIVISKGAMQKLSYSEMGFLLGHEMGHIKLGHNGKPFKNTCIEGRFVWKQLEANADVYSLEAMNKVKLNSCKGGKGFFSKLLANYGNGGGPKDSHPSNKFRLNQVREFSCENVRQR